MTLDELRHKRDHAARACADLLVRGHVAEAKRYAKESERFAENLRAALAAVSEQVEVVDLVGALRASVEAAKLRREQAARGEQS